MPRRKRSEQVIKRFPTDPNIVEFTEKRFQFSNSRSNSKMRGEELSKDEQAIENKLKVQKLRLIESKLFPCFANLIYFFESVADNDDLLDLFDDDIKDLFKIGTDHHRFLKASGYSGDESGTPLARLIYAALLMDKTDRFDFRLKLAHRIQKTIAEKALSAIEARYGHKSQIFKSAADDMKNTLGWTRFVAEMAEDERDRDIRRVVEIPIPPYLPIKASSPMSRMAREMMAGE